jgi:hypothetical protein
MTVMSGARGRGDGDREDCEEWSFPKYGSFGGKWYAFGGEPRRIGLRRPCEVDFVSLGGAVSSDMLL